MIYKPINYPDLSGNELKDVVQEEINQIQQRLADLIVLGYTGFGKTKCGKNAAKNAQGKIIVVVPSEVLQKAWNKTLHGYNFVCYIVNTISMSEAEDILRDCDTLIIDEVHTVLNKDNKYFGQTLKMVKARKRLLLSATLTEKHRAYLAELGMNDYYVVSRYWGFKHKLVPPFMSYNLPVDLTAEEKSLYLRATDAIESAKSIMAKVEVFDPYIELNDSRRAYIAKFLNTTEGAVKGILKRWKAGITARKSILYNAEEKLEMCTRLLKEYAGNEKALVFCMTTAFADKIAYEDNLASTLHSKMTEKARTNSMNLFLSDTKPHLISVSALKAGVDIPDCHIGIRVAFTGVDLDTTQIIGRVTRMDKDFVGEAVIISLYVRPFNARGRVIESQDEVWLKSNQKSEHFVTWLESYYQLFAENRTYD